jgi:NhaP-type Na+/H+ or K+/H+ antiporter
VENAVVIIFVGVLVFLAHLFVTLFEKTRVPDILYLILIGVVIGPVFHLVEPHDFGLVGEVFTTVALVIILFESGLQLSFAALRSALRHTLLLTLLSFATAWALLTAVIYYLTGFPLEISLFAGAALAGPAPAVVIPLVKQLKLHDATRTTLTLESALGEALCLVVGLGILRAVQLQEVEFGRSMGRLLSAFLIAVLIGGGGGYVWSLLLHRMRRLQHAIFTTPSFVFIIFGICEFLGFSGPVAALSFGIVLGNAGLIRIPWLTQKVDLEPIHHNEIEKLFFGEIVFLLKTFFFVYMGISIQFSNLQTVWIACALTGILLVARTLSVRISTDPSVTPAEDAKLMGVMVPKGLATAVLAALPLHLGLAGGAEIQALVYGVVLVSVIATGVLIFLLERTLFTRLYGLIFTGYSGTHQPQPDS